MAHDFEAHSAAWWDSEAHEEYSIIARCYLLMTTRERQLMAIRVPPNAA